MSPLPANTLLAPHFTAGELRADTPGISNEAIANLRFVAGRLEQMREEIFSSTPMIITSGYRSPEYNAKIGGSPTSDHVNGLGVDFYVKGMSLFEAFSRLKDAERGGRLPPFDQLIYYPGDGHIHVGYGPKNRRETLIKIGETYQAATADSIATLPGFIAEATNTVKNVVKEAGSATSGHLVIIGALSIAAILAILLTRGGN